MTNQGVGIDQKKGATVKALLAARDFLLDELRKLSDAIDQKVDLTELTSELKQSRFSSVLQPYLGIAEDILEVRTSSNLQSLKRVYVMPHSSKLQPLKMLTLNVVFLDLFSFVTVETRWRI